MSVINKYVDATTLDNSLTELANVIRGKSNKNDNLSFPTPNDFAKEVSNLSVNDNATLASKTILSNGTYYAINDDVDGYGNVTVNVKPSYQDRTKWYRPPDWPDYAALEPNLPSDKSMAFFTFDTQVCDIDDLICNICWYDYNSLTYYRVQVDRGTIQNGQFIINQSYTNLYYAIQKIGQYNDFPREIPTNEGRYVVYRVWCPIATKANTLDTFLSSFTSRSGISRGQEFSPIVEAFFWRCGNSTSPSRGLERSTIYTQIHTFKHCYMSGGTSLYYQNARKCPRYIEIEGSKNTNFSWYYPFRDQPGLEYLSFKDLTINNTNSIGQAFSTCSRLNTIIFNNVNVSTISLNSCFLSDSSLRSLNLSGWTVSSVTNASNCFNGCSSLLSLNISGWDLSSVTNATDMFKNTTNLRTIICTNTILPSQNLSIPSAYLTEQSLIEIANALPVGSYTLTLNATPKGLCDTIMGIINNNKFIADENGTTSLTDFITITKEWTLA